MSDSIYHKSVLENEVLNTFKNLKNSTIIDATIGYGGHSKLLLDNLKNIKIIGIDKDKFAIDNCILKDNKDVSFINDTFSNIKSNIKSLSGIGGILVDFGVSSPQFDNKNRGFCFDSDILDMRMDINQDLTAFDVVNYYSQEKLENIFNLYADIRNYKKIASMIIEKRKETKIQSARDLSDLFGSGKIKGINPATLVFQAIRIEVNQELNEIEKLLDFIEKHHVKDFIVAMISFHSLEDRIVKNRFKSWSLKCICTQDAFKCLCGNNNEKGKILTKKPIVPTKEEVLKNKRSRSSKLRVFQFNKNSG